RGNLVLAPVRNVDVIRAGLERLDESSAEIVRVALENKSAVDAGDRQHPVDVRFRSGRIVEIVMRHVQTRTRGDEPRVAPTRPRYRWIEESALPADKRGLMKANEFTVGGKVQAVP